MAYWTVKSVLFKKVFCTECIHVYTYIPIFSSRRGEKCDGKGCDEKRTGDDGLTGRISDDGGVVRRVATFNLRLSLRTILP